ncbi:aspartyl/asparaginyl beta-hydroxylase domain-containing protein [Sphingobium sp.]|uniref:aspartyl/asparaginyl beta-hydroxylase domain-containing protein n=1 Tax=Sphingobium sp. TaxID=1912891 RepID=UPI003B3B1F70
MNVQELDKAADAAAARRDIKAARGFLMQRVALEPSFDALLKLGALAKAQGDAGQSLAMIDRALTLRPLDLMALLMRATQLQAMGRDDDAGVAFGRALGQCDPHNPPRGLAPAIAMAQDRHASWQRRQVARFTAAVEAATGAAPSPRMARFITNICRLTQPDRDGPTHYCYPDLEEIGYYPDARFEWLAQLAAATGDIADELAALLSIKDRASTPYVQYPDGLPLDQWAALNNNRDWSALHLIEKGVVNDANARHCPKSMAVLKTLPQPDIAGAGPNAMFSLLAPHTHIPPHTGVSNTRLVCHLPLVVPQGCWFRVGEERREWAKGTPWVFDDTVDHEAMNPTDQLRVVMIFDIWHPDLDADERRAISAIIAAGGRIHGL